jgi:glutathione S-transferase
MSQHMMKLYGALGSPYSMKMRAIMRYRRLPHLWVQMRVDTPNVFAKVKAPVIPVLEFADGTAMNDSTPLLYDLEQRFPDHRSIVPTDEAQAFFAFLLEDMADEWGTKLMFHHRWYLKRDQDQCSHWIIFDRLMGQGKAAVEATAKAFRDRQVGRMALVGCTPQNAPLIEETGRQIYALFNDQIPQTPFLFGTRPSLADFAWYGQLSQNAVDPTPADLMRETAPYLFRWMLNIDDLSGWEGGDWHGPDLAPTPAAMGLLKLAGSVYFPFLLANEAAIARGEETFSFKALGHAYGQGVFKYQVKCLAALRQAYDALSAAAKAKVDPIAQACGFLEALKPA